MKDLLRVVTAYMSAPPAWLGPLSAWVSSHPDTVRWTVLYSDRELCYPAQVRGEDLSAWLAGRGLGAGHWEACKGSKPQYVLL